MNDPGSALAMLASSAAIGLFGGVHCIGMCGGIAGALSHALPAAQRTRFPLLLTQLQYSVGRILSYAIAGAAAGALGQVLQRLLGPSGGAVLRVVAGLLLVALGLYVSGWWRGLAHLERAAGRLWGAISPAARHLLAVSSATRRILLGMLWGWLPCGLVYSMLASAVSSGNAATGAFLMTGFGIGTLPALLVTGSLAGRLTLFVRRRNARWAAGLLIMLFGIWTLLGSSGVVGGGAGGAHHH